MTSQREAFEIKHRYTNDILRTVNADTLSDADLCGEKLAICPISMLGDIK